MTRRRFLQTIAVLPFISPSLGFEQETVSEFIPLERFLRTYQIQVVSNHGKSGFAYLTSHQSILKINTIEHVERGGIKEIKFIQASTDSDSLVNQIGDTFFISPQDLGLVQMLLRENEVDLSTQITIAGAELINYLNTYIANGSISLFHKTYDHPNLHNNGLFLSFSPYVGWKVLKATGSITSQEFELEGVLNLTTGDSAASVCQGMSGGPVVPLITQEQAGSIVITGVASSNGLPMVVGEMQHTVGNEIAIPYSPSQSLENTACNWRGYVNRVGLM